MPTDLYAVTAEGSKADIVGDNSQAEEVGYVWNRVRNIDKSQVTTKDIMVKIVEGAQLHS
jgi:hypothetical protein